LPGAILGQYPFHELRVRSAIEHRVDFGVELLESVGECLGVIGVERGVKHQLPFCFRAISDFRSWQFERARKNAKE
jgi:hypothetical protein